MNQSFDDPVALYMRMLRSPLMQWVTWISLASVVIVCVIAWRKGLSVWKWFLYSALLGPVALVHILFKPEHHDPPESSRAL